MITKIRADKRNICTSRVLLWKHLFVIVFCGFMGITVIAAPSDELTPIIPPPKGLSVSGLPETYYPNTLYEKINGQAELYLSVGFVELKSQWYELEEDTSKFIEVNIYNMGSLLNAFSVYSQQHRSDAEKFNITQFAYLTQGAIFFVHGSYYVEILPTDFSDTMPALTAQLAEKFIKETHVEETHIKEIDFFPHENMDKGSITLIPKDVFGMERLDRVFTATYTLRDSQLTVFISDRKKPKEAQSLVDKIHRHFMSLGGNDVRTEADIKGVRMLEVMGNYELVFSIGPYIVGVHEAKTKLEAEKMGETLRNFLNEKFKQLMSIHPTYNINMKL